MSNPDASPAPSSPTPPSRPTAQAARRPSAAAALSRRNIMLYGTLIVVALYYLLPLYVMVVTSLKGMPEIRLGNIFSPPLEITFQPWVKAWAEACTGLNCDGLSPRLLELGPHHRALGDHLDRHRLGERLRAVQLALQGRQRLLRHPDLRRLHPLQVMLYPIVIILRTIGLYGTLTGLVIVHSIFGMPILTLLFRNYFTSVPEELFKAARIDGAGFWGIYFKIMLPMALPIFVVAIILQVMPSCCSLQIEKKAANRSM